MLSIKSPPEMAAELAERLKTLRLARAWSREELARRSGVTVSSIKRFETTGEIALARLLMLAFILDALEDFEKVFQRKAPRTMKEVKAMAKRRQRGARQKK